MIISNILRFIIVLILQLLVFDNIQLSGYINPFFYVLFILLMPFETPRILLLLSSFFLGLTIDIFHHSYGMHAAASLFIAFVRPTVVNYIQVGKEYDIGKMPSIGHIGIGRFLSYASILVFMHHFIYFFLEVFRFSNFFNTLYRIILSSIATIFVIIVQQLIFSKENK